MEFEVVINEPSVITIMVLTAYLLWCIQTYSTDGYVLYTEWRSLTKMDRIFGGIEIAFGVVITALVLLSFRTAVERMAPIHQTLWNQGLAIGTASALCVIVSAGVVGIISRSWLDYLHQNLKTLRHYTFLVSSVFLGVFLGLTAKAYNPSFTWIPSVESVVGLFLAVLLMSFVVGLLNNAFTLVPTAEQVRPNGLDRIERGLTALIKRIVATPLYHKIDTLDGKWTATKNNRYRLILYLLLLMFLALYQMIVSRLIFAGIQAGLSVINPTQMTMATTALGLINISILYMMISLVIIMIYRQQR